MEWISVKDRLPEKPCNVLTALERGMVFQMSYHAKFYIKKRIFHRWVCGEWIDHNSQVTHWMPLPEPPKED